MIGDYEYPSMEAFHASGRRCGSYKLKEDVDRDEAEHQEILESILSSSFVWLVIFMPLTSVTRNMYVYYFLHES
jgi:hypothetical protein